MYIVLVIMLIAACLTLFFVDIIWQLLRKRSEEVSLLLYQLQLVYSCLMLFGRYLSFQKQHAGNNLSILQ